MTDALRCSFCGKSQYDVEKLFAGPTAFICSECVALCDRILLPTMHRTMTAEDIGARWLLADI